MSDDLEVIRQYFRLNSERRGAWQVRAQPINFQTMQSGGARVNTLAVLAERRRIEATKSCGSVRACHAPRRSDTKQSPQPRRLRVSERDRERVRGVVGFRYAFQSQQARDHKLDLLFNRL